MNIKAGFWLSALALLSSTYSDKTETNNSQVISSRYSNCIGVAAGITSGFGLSFKKWFLNGWGFQINLMPWYDETNYSDSDHSGYYYQNYDGYNHEGTGSIGLLALRSLSEAKYWKFITYAGGNAFINYEKYDYYSKSYNYSYYNPDNRETTHHVGKKFSNTVTAGAGCGTEFYIWRFSFHCMIGLRGSIKMPDKTKNLSPSIEGGVHFMY